LGSRQGPLIEIIDQLLTKVSISALLFRFDRVKIGAFY